MQNYQKALVLKNIKHIWINANTLLKDTTEKKKDICLYFLGGKVLRDRGSVLFANIPQCLEADVSKNFTQSLLS